ncbi:MAG: hypothetical protein A3B70_06900 [Deltaproteobacteria bacterium RIFCSPHIGHO2_02_FULL_40_11]|nr:MAG: hypothetical protein A3B70_06900 [Deltaproteobacteria bacterium RIFCSPHIGHO2_02_FULL_40_11]
MSQKTKILGALFIALASASVLGSYEMVRSPTTVLFKATFGTHYLPVVMAIIPLAVIAVVYLYGILLSYLGPRKTLFTTTLGSAVIIGLSYWAHHAGFKFASAFLYVFRQAYIVILIEQYWSFINSTFDQKIARKLNGPIAGISSIGAVLGGIFVGKYAQNFGAAELILGASVFLLPAAFLSDIAYRICGEPKASHTEQEGKKGHLHLSLFKTSPLLSLLFGIILTTQMFSVFLSLIFQNILQDMIPNVNAQTAYLGNFYATVNGVAAFFQFIAAPIFMSIFPIHIIHLAIPLLHLVMAGLLMYSPTLALAGAAFLIFKSVDYSIFRASKEVLYIPLSFDARYRAKEMIDVFGYRFGKGATSLGITLIQSAGLILTPFFTWGALMATALWVGLIFPIVKYMPRRMKEPTV